MTVQLDERTGLWLKQLTPSARWKWTLAIHPAARAITRGEATTSAPRDASAPLTRTRTSTSPATKKACPTSTARPSRNLPSLPGYLGGNPKKGWPDSLEGNGFKLPVQHTGNLLPKCSFVHSISREYGNFLLNGCSRYNGIARSNSPLFFPCFT